MQRSAWLVLVLITLIVPVSPASAAPGDLDPAFGGDGKVTTTFSGGAVARDVAVQVDGKIVAVGQSRGGNHAGFALARYDRDGALDTTFGKGGRVATRFIGGAIPYAVAIQRDGKIVLAGDGGGRFLLARYRPNGDLDTTFGGDGKVRTGFAGGDALARGVAIQANGRIVVVGESVSGSCCPSDGKFAVARYMKDGTIDTSLGGNGKVTTAFSIGNGRAADVAVQADGKIVAVGTASCPESCSRFATVRYEPDGTPDAEFGDNGEVVTRLTRNDEGYGVAIQGDGKIVVAGRAGHCCEYTGSFGLVRYLPDGSLDVTFGGDGKVITNVTRAEDSAADAAIQADGKIVVFGGAGFDGKRSAFALARYREGGTLDTGFGANGKVKARFAPGMNGASSMAIQDNGKIVVAGWIQQMFALARFLAAR